KRRRADSHHSSRHDPSVPSLGKRRVNATTEVHLVDAATEIHPAEGREAPGSASAPVARTAAGRHEEAGYSLLCFPTDRAAYGRLSELISLGQRRAAKGQCELWLEDVLAYAEGQIFVVL